ncbi:hypothetical protein EV363DRAFT_1221727 [Boletus edulis]|nr:hypothetical protein EV363DRAFT_1221727 [Boletus edulis]
MSLRPKRRGHHWSPLRSTCHHSTQRDNNTGLFLCSVLPFVSRPPLATLEHRWHGRSRYTRRSSRMPLQITHYRCRFRSAGDDLVQCSAYREHRLTSTYRSSSTMASSAVPCCRVVMGINEQVVVCCPFSHRIFNLRYGSVPTLIIASCFRRFCWLSYQRTRFYATALYQDEFKIKICLAPRSWHGTQSPCSTCISCLPCPVCEQVIRAMSLPMTTPAGLTTIETGFPRRPSLHSVLLQIDGLAIPDDRPTPTSSFGLPFVMTSISDFLAVLCSCKTHSLLAVRKFLSAKSQCQRWTRRCKRPLFPPFTCLVSSNLSASAIDASRPSWEWDIDTRQLSLI